MLRAGHFSGEWPLLAGIAARHVINDHRNHRKCHSSPINVYISDWWAHGCHDCPARKARELVALFQHPCVLPKGTAITATLWLVEFQVILKETSRPQLPALIEDEIAFHMYTRNVVAAGAPRSRYTTATAARIQRNTCMALYWIRVRYLISLVAHRTGCYVPCIMVSDFASWQQLLQLCIQAVSRPRRFEGSGLNVGSTSQRCYVRIRCNGTQVGRSQCRNSRLKTLRV